MMVPVSGEHAPVLLEPALAALNIRPEGIYVDGTFGRGGHSRAILARLGERGTLIAFDKDPAAIEAGRQLEQEDKRFRIFKGSFAMMATTLTQLGMDRGVDGILVDLGVSSPQLDDADRGFSFMDEGPLDMRMDNEQGESAADFVNTAEEGIIADVIYQYGEERYSRRIAASIARARKESPITTTTRLAEIVEAAVPRREKNKHPATRTFQAIRIHVNHELEDLDAFLGSVTDCLAPGGRFVAISFHSLETRMVKQFIQRETRGEPDLSPDLPVPSKKFEPRLKKIGKLVKPDDEETKQNPRARSAVMRVVERLQ